MSLNTRTAEGETLVTFFPVNDETPMCPNNVFTYKRQPELAATLIFHFSFGLHDAARKIIYPCFHCSFNISVNCLTTRGLRRIIILYVFP